MQILNILQNSNISPNLQSLKFMRGFAAAKSFLLQLKATKEQDNDKKPQNSIAFSPIAQHSSIASEQNTSRETGRISEVRTIRENRPLQKEQKKEVTIDYLKTQINIQTKLLNEQHSELIYIERAIDVLADHLRKHSNTFKKIQQHKHQERQKNIRLFSLKSSVDKKKLLLEESIKKRQKFKQILRKAVKDHLMDQYENFNVDSVLHLAKDIIVKQTPQLEGEDPEDHPQKLQLKFRTIKKKQKEKKKQEFVSQPPLKQKDKDKQTKGLIEKFNKLAIDSDTYYDTQFVD